MKETLIGTIERVLDEKQAENIVVIDFENRHPMFDAAIICTSLNHKHGYALLGYLKEAILKNGYQVKNIEGHPESDWLLMDCFDVVVHIFDYQGRQLYGLDKHLELLKGVS